MISCSWYFEIAPKFYMHRLNVSLIFDSKPILKLNLRSNFALYLIPVTEGHFVK